MISAAVSGLTGLGQLCSFIGLSTASCAALAMMDLSQPRSARQAGPLQSAMNLAALRTTSSGVFSGSEAELPSAGRSWISGYARSGLIAPAQNGFAMTEMSAAPYIRAAGLTLNDRVELVFRTVAAAADTATLEYSDDGENWSIVPGLDGTMDELLGTGTGYIVSEISHGYEIRILSLMPHQYGRLYRLTVGENGHAQVTYSVNSYIYRMWESSSVGTLVSCLYAYELSAAAYAGFSL